MKRPIPQGVGFFIGTRFVCPTSYGQIWCMPMKSSGDLVRLLNFFSVNELHPLDDLRKVREAA